MTVAKARKRILSGIQPSGKLHLGNYFGAIRQHIALQDENECFYFIADYHAMTTLAEATAAANKDIKAGKQKPFTPGQILRDNVRDVAMDYLALGLDPNKATLFRQSDVPQVCELAWILATVTSMGLLERAHSFKEKSDRGIAPSMGLFTYPILMAADILIYRSDIVPVGQDQVQHLEMTRDMAGYFNRAYGEEVFPMPQEKLDAGAKVPGTDGQKMSKSYGNTIGIFAAGNELKKPVMGIVTDTLRPEEPKDPNASTIYQLYQLVANEDETAAMAERFRQGGLGYGDAKKMLLDKLEMTFGPLREKRQQLAARPDDLEDILRAGAKRANEEANKTMEIVRRVTGLGR
jgi:tryptophanyl-tRNA synthetase